jgi:Rrf2 family protein
MMRVSQKCQYALRGLFELAKRHGQGAVSVADIARAQAIPPRFLELILRQLRQGGMVESRRGARGGYLLVADPATITVGQVVRFTDGPLSPVSCIAGEGGAAECPLHGGCAFLEMWEEAQDALAGVFDRTTLEDLVKKSEREVQYVASYSI